MSGKLDLTGFWKSDRSENLDEYLEALGLPENVRKVAAKVTMIQEFRQKDGEYIVRRKSPKGIDENVFTLGKETGVVLPNGKVVRGVPKLENNKLIITMTSEEKDGDDVKTVTQTITREIVNGELIQTTQLGDVICKRYFVRYEKKDEEDKKEETES